MAAIEILDPDGVRGEVGWAWPLAREWLDRQPRPEGMTLEIARDHAHHHLYTVGLRIEARGVPHWAFFHAFDHDTRRGTFLLRLDMLWEMLTKATGRAKETR